MATPSPAPATDHVSERHRNQGRIVKALAQLAGMNVAIGLGGVIRNKVMAVYLKPAGFGEFSQLLSIALAVYVFVQFGMSVGLSRHTAAGEDHETKQRQLGTANMLTVGLALSSLVVLIPLLFSPWGNPLLTRLGVQPGIQQKLLLTILLCVAPIEALRNNYMSFLQGLLDIKGISTKRSLSIAASTAAGVPVIAMFRAVGACIHTMFASFFAALFLGLRCKTVGFKPLEFRWDPRTMMTLAGWGTASLVSIFSLNAVDTLIRARLISFAGVSENGYYQVALLISTLVTTIILGSIGAYSLASLSETKDKTTIESRMSDLLRTVLPVSTIALGTLGLLSQPILAILFSASFEQSAKYLPIILAANYVQAAAWVIGAPMLGFGLIRTFVVVQLMGAVVRYVSSIGLLRWIGVEAIPAGFLAAMIFDLSANLFVCKVRIGLYLEPRMLLKFVAGGFAIGACAMLGYGMHSWLIILPGLILLSGITYAIAPSEMAAAYKHAVQRVNNYFAKGSD